GGSDGQRPWPCFEGCSSAPPKVCFDKITRAGQRCSRRAGLDLIAEPDMETEPAAIWKAATVAKSEQIRSEKAIRACIAPRLGLGHNRPSQFHVTSNLRGCDAPQSCPLHMCRYRCGYGKSSIFY